MSLPDRTVHASNSEAEVVRYDRAGKWYIEPRDPSLQRQHVTVKQAAQYAVWMAENANGVIHSGVPGGGSFDRAINAECWS
jgi:hypothetical protein